MKRCLVIGAGVSGCTAALELARLGHRVTLLESSGRPGGKAVSYACKATDTCSRCGVCVAHSRIADALLNHNVTLLEGATVDKVQRSSNGIVVRGHSLSPRIRRQRCTGCGDCVPACPAGALSLSRRGGLSLVAIDFASCLLRQDGSCTACVDACPAGAVTAGSARSAFALRTDAVLLATGHDNFDPAAKPRLGSGRVPGVMTGYEAEQVLSRQTWLPDGRGAAARRIAFIQCVGSRDPSLGRGFCSSVCCAAALRMARLLAARSPSAEVTVYYIDIQNFDKVFSPLRAELESLGIRFVRGIPFSVTAASAGSLAVQIEDPEGGRSSAEHDAVVLSAGISPSPGTERLAELFGASRDEFGFICGADSDSNAGNSADSAQAVLAAGTCAEPQGILESISSARAAALEMVR